MIQFLKKIFNSKKSEEPINEVIIKNDPILESMISKYVDLFITIDNFKYSYSENFTIPIEDYSHLPHQIKLISFKDIKNEEKYTIYLECMIQDRYNTKVLFHMEDIYYNNPNWISIIRESKLDQLV